MSLTWIDAHDAAGRPTVDFVLERDQRRAVTGALWLPDAASADRPLVCFGHGASGDRYQTPIPQLAVRFAGELGCPVLSIDGPVHGLREVHPGGRDALFPELQRPGAIADMIEEWNVAIDVAHGHEAIGHRPLAYFGLSMGSLFGIPLVAARDDVVVATLGLLGTTGATGHLREPLLDAARGVTCPVAYLMQLEDELFHRDGYLELFDALASEDKRLHANPGLHPEVPLEELIFAYEFMRSHIERTPTRRIVNPLAE